MLPRVRIRCTLAGLFCLALPAVAFAQDPDTSRQSSAEVVIDGEELGVIVSEAVGDIAAVLADLQIEIRMGQDNRMDLSVEDKTYELDIDAILEQVGMALEAGLGELETQDWTSVTVRDDHDQASDHDQATAAELRVELDDLRHELQDLQAELAKLRKND
jgi:hypothetical protein